MLSIFLNLRKSLIVQFLLSRFPWQKHLAAIRQIIKVLPGNLSRLNECATRGVDPEILKGGQRSMSATMVGQQKKLGFRWSKKAEITLETISFLAKYLYQYLQIFSIFIDKVLLVFQNLLTR